ncbi:glutamate-rich protein 6B isoform X2 [Antechinus flavipes]|uniref:glutamate-rich protein 6B isoform X2 n=1 Tax=Antechinus flavipes TaxID=38775 RepID=UPI002235AAB8|nr:glutamate-rich protein 6B isoform X2 [Antechinus flavipes]
MSEKKFLPINVHPSSHKLTLNSPTSSTENFADKEHKKLLPEISVTKEEKEKSRTEKIRKLEFLTNDQVVPTQSSSSSASSSPNVFTLPSLSFPSMKTSNPLKTSSVPAFISFKTEEEDYKEKLKSVMKVTPGLSLPSTSSFFGNSSSSFFSIPVPVSLPSSQLGSTLLDIQMSTSISCSTQTEWFSDDSDEEFRRNHFSKDHLIKKDRLDNIKLTPAIRKRRKDTATQIQPHLFKGLLNFPFKGNILGPKMEASSSETIIESELPIPLQNQSSRLYQTIFKHVLQEVMDREAQAALDTDVSSTAELKEETRRKLALMFKTNFERYKDVFKQILKRRGSANEKKEVKITKAYHIIYVPEASLPNVSALVEIDEEWVKNTTKVHRGFGVPAWYKGLPGKDYVAKQFSIFFPDGTGQIYYPSGNIAMVICEEEDTGFFIYLIFKDEQQLQLQGIVNNLGHATFYDKDNNICQDKVFITLSDCKQNLHLNMGTKIQAKDPYSEMKLQNQPILDTYKLEKIVQVIQSLLKKMRELRCKTRLDLENFVKGSSYMSPVENHLRAGKLSAVLTSFGRIRTA